MRNSDELAEGFILEYLESRLQYIDVVEFVDDNYDAEPNDAVIDETYQKIASILDTISQRYDVDSEN